MCVLIGQFPVVCSRGAAQRSLYELNDCQSNKTAADRFALKNEYNRLTVRRKTGINREVIMNFLKDVQLSDIGYLKVMPLPGGIVDY
jgi:hypothetical protein